MNNSRKQPSEDAAVTGRMNVARSKLRDEVFRASQRSFSESSTAPNPHQSNLLNTPSLASFYSGVPLAQPSASSGAAAMPIVLKTTLETQLTNLLHNYTHTLSKLPPAQHSSLQEKYLRTKDALVAYWLEQYETTGILPQSPYSQLPSLYGHDSGSSVTLGILGGDGPTLSSSVAPKLDESITVQPSGTEPVYHVRDVAQARGVGNAVWNTYVGIGSGTLDVAEQETEK